MCQLCYFLAVARHRSFTRAAVHENVHQPSLSYNPLQNSMELVDLHSQA
ncbi:MAG: LysR family transcriptional regulator [Acidobacteria bacterium]|nr:LysR family transcriptional regulator [Acidobacteriota bacterium]